MQVQRINITLPTVILKALQADIPAGKRSKFIANALSEKLRKRATAQKELARSLKANAEFYRKESKQIEEDFKYADAEILKQLP